MRRWRPGVHPRRTADEYDYLIEARQRVFDRVRTLSQAQYTRKFPFSLATQSLFHEVHHRAQVMAMLRLLGVPVQSIDYSLMRWEWFKEHR